MQNNTEEKKQYIIALIEKSTNKLKLNIFVRFENLFTADDAKYLLKRYGRFLLNKPVGKAEEKEEKPDPLKGFGTPRDKDWEPIDKCGAIRMFTDKIKNIDLGKIYDSDGDIIENFQRLAFEYDLIFKDYKISMLTEDEFQSLFK